MSHGKQSDEVLLRYIRECIDELREYTAGTTNTSDQPRKTQWAVERVLQILAQATQELNENLKATEPQIPWKQIAGLRNRLVHAYMNTDHMVISRILPPQARSRIQTKAVAGAVSRPWRSLMFGQPLRRSVSTMPGRGLRVRSVKASVGCIAVGVAVVAVGLAFGSLGA